MTLALVDRTGSRTLRLGERLPESGSSGRTVYATSDTALVAHIWDSSDGHDETVRRIERLIKEGPPRSPSQTRIVWPVGLLRESARIVGHASCRVADARSLDTLLALPDYGLAADGPTWRVRHEILERLAAALAAVHGAGYIVGDLDPKDVLIERDGTVCLTGADAWQFGDLSRSEGFFPARPRMSDFAAPELRGMDAQRVVGTQEADSFALAVIIFSVLLGHHPFRGRWHGRGEIPSAGTLMRDGVSVFDPAGRMTISSSGMPIDRLSPPLAELLRQTFASGCLDPSDRPSVGQWRQALAEAAGTLKLCPIDSKHDRFEHWSDCYWCRLRTRQTTDSDAGQGTLETRCAVFGALDEALERSDDEAIAELLERSAVGLRLDDHPKARAIRSAVDRVAKLRAWRVQVAQSANEFWLPLRRWPEELDESPMAARRTHEGRPLVEYIGSLRALRRQVDDAELLAAEWSKERRTDDKRFAADKVLPLLDAVIRALPVTAPEASTLQDARRRIAAWVARFDAMSQDVEKAVRLRERGSDEEAWEKIEKHCAEWSDFEPLIALQSLLGYVPLPWDRADLRSQIRLAVAEGDLGRAVSGLSLLPDTAMPDERGRVRRAIEAVSADLQAGRTLLKSAARPDNAIEQLETRLRAHGKAPGIRPMLFRLQLARRSSAASKAQVVTPTVDRRSLPESPILSPFPIDDPTILPAHAVSDLPSATTETPRETTVRRWGRSFWTVVVVSVVVATATVFAASWPELLLP